MLETGQLRQMADQLAAVESRHPSRACESHGSV